ncbi:chlorophyllase/cutinase-like alpha/beta fold protein [Kribbella italica]|uniref:Dienelactone hydrolase n=1 Tax=Kribbella italica TaxID=1540520 RepID=A0A7W9JE54_9ACTN|nr:acetylxylan esterase [Kribbella italica]MBB5840305.1 dienelactone hydrolase [Kribbella italica]
MPGRRAWTALAAAAALSVVVPSVQPALAAPPASAAVAAAVDPAWARPGPSAVKVQVLPAHTLYYPASISGRAPVVVWGNGTFAETSVYDGLLRHLASHGFIVAAANTTFSGTGVEMRAGIDLLAGLDQQAGSELYRHVDLQHIGAAGHSQGGQGAINAGADERIDATVPLQPGPLALPATLKGPALFLSGASDFVVPAPLVLAMWSLAPEGVYASLKGAGHDEPTGDGGGFRGVVTAWFKYQLTGNTAAAEEFTGTACGVCTDAAFTGVRRK